MIGVLVLAGKISEYKYRYIQSWMCKETKGTKPVVDVDHDDILGGHSFTYKPSFGISSVGKTCKINNQPERTLPPPWIQTITGNFPVTEGVHTLRNKQSSLWVTFAGKV